MKGQKRSPLCACSSSVKAGRHVKHKFTEHMEFPSIKSFRCRIKDNNY